jgi:hypothetical protein
MTTQQIIKPFVYMTQELIERIKKDMPKVSMATYTKGSLQKMVNDARTYKMEKETYLSYCVGYIHDSVIHANMSGKTHLEHDYEISCSIYSSALAFNESLLEKLELMFPDAEILVKNRMLNFVLNSTVLYTLSIRW